MPHLGHGRYALIYDVLRRYLEFRGYAVRYVSNITDIEDKLIERARAEVRSVEELASTYERLWWEAMDALEVKRPSEAPHATEYIAEMVSLVAELVERGVAYETTDGVYLSVDKVPDYGLLARQVPGSPPRRCPGGTRRSKTRPARLRPVEEGEAGRAVLALPVGSGAPRLAHRVRGDVAQTARRGLRHPRRRDRPRLPPSRERARPVSCPRPATSATGISSVLFISTDPTGRPSTSTS